MIEFRQASGGFIGALLDKDGELIEERILVSPAEVAEAALQWAASRPNAWAQAGGSSSLH